MPFTRGRAKKISKRHILGWRDIKTKPSVASTDYVDALDNTIKTSYVPKIIKKLLNHINAGIRRHIRNLRNQSSYLLGTWNLTPDEWETVSYSQEHLQTAYYDTVGRQYYSNKDGVYHVDVFMLLQYNRELTLDRAKLALYKNGEPYKLLDYKSSANYNVDDQNITMQGSCLVNMDCGDYIEVKFWYDGILTLALENLTYEYGYFDVHYSGCNSTEVAPMAQGWEADTYI